jgi:rubredoxin
MAYSENNSVINTDVNVTAGGYVTKKYLLEAYPQLSDQAKSAGLWNWGYNPHGGLGDNTTIPKSSPVQTISGGANWKLVTTGRYHSAALKTDGTLWLWGQNYYGVLGDNTNNNKSSPIQTVAAGTNWQLLSCGLYNPVAIKTDGTLWSWGQNFYGNLGDNTNTPKSSPVQTIAGGTNWKLCSSGGYHVAAIKTDGTLWTWGFNDQGQLGTNNNTRRSSPVQTISGGTNWKKISCSKFGTAAIKTDGTLWSWGFNPNGQLGDNSRTNQNSPVQTVAGGTNWKDVSYSWQHSCAIKTDGTLWLWGLNADGQLGDNTITSKSSPIQTISGGTNWKLMASGNYYSTGVIKTDGTLWVWGINNWGQLGDNTRTPKSSPVQTIAGGTNWKQVNFATVATVAIKDFNEDF